MNTERKRPQQSTPVLGDYKAPPVIVDELGDLTPEERRQIAEAEKEIRLQQQAKQEAKDSDFGDLTEAERILIAQAEAEIENQRKLKEEQEAALLKQLHEKEEKDRQETIRALERQADAALQQSRIDEEKRQAELKKIADAEAQFINVDVEKLERERQARIEAKQRELEQSLIYTDAQKDEETQQLNKIIARLTAKNRLFATKEEKVPLTSEEVNHQNKLGHSAAWIAVKLNRPADLKLLIDTGYVKLLGDKWGQNPVFIASQLGHFDCLRLLLLEAHRSGQDREVTRLDNFEHTPASIALNNGKHDCFALLFEVGAANDELIMALRGTKEPNGGPKSKLTNPDKHLKAIEHLLTTKKITYDTVIPGTGGQTVIEIAESGFSSSIKALLKDQQWKAENRIIVEARAQAKREEREREQKEKEEILRIAREAEKEEKINAILRQLQPIIDKVNGFSEAQIQAFANENGGQNKKDFLRYFFALPEGSGKKHDIYKEIIGDWTSKLHLFVSTPDYSTYKTILKDYEIEYGNPKSLEMEGRAKKGAQIKERVKALKPSEVEGFAKRDDNKENFLIYFQAITRREERLEIYNEVIGSLTSNLHKFVTTKRGLLGSSTYAEIVAQCEEDFPGKAKELEAHAKAEKERVETEEQQRKTEAEKAMAKEAKEQQQRQAEAEKAKARLAKGKEILEQGNNPEKFEHYNSRDLRENLKMVIEYVEYVYASEQSESAKKALTKILAQEIIVKKKSGLHKLFKSDPDMYNKIKTILAAHHPENPELVEHLELLANTLEEQEKVKRLAYENAEREEAEEAARKVKEEKEREEKRLAEEKDKQRKIDNGREIYMCLSLDTSIPGYITKNIDSNQDDVYLFLTTQPLSEKVYIYDIILGTPGNCVYQFSKTPRTDSKETLYVKARALAVKDKDEDFVQSLERQAAERIEREKAAKEQAEEKEKQKRIANGEKVSEFMYLPIPAAINIESSQDDLCLFIESLEAEAEKDIFYKLILGDPNSNLHKLSKMPRHDSNPTLYVRVRNLAGESYAQKLEKRAAQIIEDARIERENAEHEQRKKAERNEKLAKGKEILDQAEKDPDSIQSQRLNSPENLKKALEYIESSPVDTAHRILTKIIANRKGGLHKLFSSVPEMYNQAKELLSLGNAGLVERLEREADQLEQKEKAEKERQRLEQEKIERERAEAELRAKEQAEREAREKAERLAEEKRRAEQAAKEKAEREQREREAAERARAEKERIEAERQAKEKAEREAREAAEKERIAKEKAAREQREKEAAERAQAEKDEATRSAGKGIVDYLRNKELKQSEIEEYARKGSNQANFVDYMKILDPSESDSILNAAVGNINSNFYIFANVECGLLRRSAYNDLLQILQGNIGEEDANAIAQVAVQEAQKQVSPATTGFFKTIRVYKGMPEEVHVRTEIATPEGFIPNPEFKNG